MPRSRRSNWRAAQGTRLGRRSRGELGQHADGHLTCKARSSMTIFIVEPQRPLDFGSCLDFGRNHCSAGLDMTFRRNSKKCLAWSNWLQRHCAELASTGIPSGLYENERNWLYFLDHASFPSLKGVPAFNVNQLTDVERRKLVEFLRLHAQIANSIAEQHTARLVYG